MPKRKRIKDWEGLYVEFYGWNQGPIKGVVFQLDSARKEYAIGVPFKGAYRSSKNRILNGNHTYEGLFTCPTKKELNDIYMEAPNRTAGSDSWIKILDDYECSLVSSGKYPIRKDIIKQVIWIVKKVFTA